MIVVVNKVVKMYYLVLDNNKNIIDNFFDGELLVFIVGIGYLILGLEDVLLGKEVGDIFSVIVELE